MVHKLKACLYDPYLNTLGGGEKYFLTVAESLSNLNYQVDIIWNGDPTVLKSAEIRFGLKLGKVNLIRSQIFSKNQLIQKYLYLREYNLSFVVSDGSLPWLFAKNNYLHFQVPFTHQSSLLDRLKLTLIKKIICNSVFTENYIRRQYLTQNTSVLYPPIDLPIKNKTISKSKQILSVGRFDNILNTKRHDILIEAFKEFSKHTKEYKLILVGGSVDINSQYINKLKSSIAKLPAEIRLNVNPNELISLYQSSSIYWHAAGFGVDEKSNPENTEHFGISIVEAMSYGCLVFAPQKGGIKEIIIDNKNGFFYDTVRELVNKTLKIITQKNQIKLRTNAIKTIRLFGKTHFFNNFKNIINHG